MTRSFVPFYYKKTENYTLYYDYKENHFFKSKVGKQHPTLPILSGTAGTVIYSLFKNKILDWGFTYPITVVVFSLLIGCILALGVIGGISYSIKKYLNDHKVIVTIPRDEIMHYLHEGIQWYKSTMLLFGFLAFIVLVNSVILLLMTNSGLFFFTNTCISAVLIVFLWAIRPIKRKKVYNWFKRKLANDEQ